MTNQAFARVLGWTGLLGLAIASSASATALNYTVIPAESNVSARFNVNGIVNVSPDLTETAQPPNGLFPVQQLLSGQSNTQPSSLSKLTADVGIPEGFNNGANGIDISVLQIHAFQVPGGVSLQSSIPLPSVPIDPLGIATPVFVSTSASVTSLQITLNPNQHITSSLTPSANPNEWLWAGLGDVTISGVIQPGVAVALQLPAGIPATPFTQQVTLPFLGNFQALANGTRVNVGIDQDAFQDQNLSLPPISQQVDILGLGLVTLTFDLNTLVLADLSTSVVYQNATPVPEPGTAALVAIGVVGLALQRRRAR
jgi:hypothetical protein